jgi:hypothetical protein
MLCRVPNTREIFGEVEVALAAKGTVSLAPADLFLTLASSAAPKFQRSRRADGSLVAFANVTPSRRSDVREFVEPMHTVKSACIPAAY